MTRRAGSVDGAVNNAGITRDAVVWQRSDDDWNDVINVTSFTGLHRNVGQANYTAAKGGIIGLTKSAAKELARFATTVNAISPTAATAATAAAGVPEDKLAELTAAIPLGRIAEPDEIPSAVALLAPEQAGYITGTVLPTDGEMSM